MEYQGKQRLVEVGLELSAYAGLHGVPSRDLDTVESERCPDSFQGPNHGVQALTMIPAWLWDYLQREPVGQVVDES